MATSVRARRTRPLACFAGIWTNWSSVRKVEEGETTNDLSAFLRTEPNAEVGAIHPKAMAVILTTPDEVETWMTAPPNEALRLQCPLPDGSLRIIARGGVSDDASVEQRDNPELRGKRSRSADRASEVSLRRQVTKHASSASGRRCLR